jgi:Helicase conserved C-terminal domain
MFEAPGRWERAASHRLHAMGRPRILAGTASQRSVCGKTAARSASRPSPGITRQDRREQVKLAFNADPAKEPLRILRCTDAAREGINLQTRCHDLIHFDLPWNPSWSSATDGSTASCSRLRL